MLAVLLYGGRQRLLQFIRVFSACNVFCGTVLVLAHPRPELTFVNFLMLPIHYICKYVGHPHSPHGYHTPSTSFAQLPTGHVSLSVAVLSAAQVQERGNGLKRQEVRRIGKKSLHAHKQRATTNPNKELEPKWLESSVFFVMGPKLTT